MRTVDASVDVRSNSFIVQIGLKMNVKGGRMTQDWRVRTGALRRQRTRTEIIDTVEKLVFDHLDNGTSLESISFRAVAAAAHKSPTTVSNAFGGSVNAMYAALSERLRSTETPVPTEVANRARAHTEHAARTGDPGRRLRRELAQTKPADLAGRMRLYEKMAQSTPIQHAEAACAVAQSHLTIPGGARDALMFAEEALETCKHSSTDAALIPAALQSARLAATAARFLVRQSPEPDAEVANLMRVHDFKLQESKYAAALADWPAESMAQFHANRAHALLMNSADEEVSAIHTVVRALRDHGEAGRTIPDDALASVLARILAVQVAYPDRGDVELRDDQDVLITLFPKPHSDIYRSATSLLAVVRFGQQWSHVPPTPVDLLRATSFGVVGQLSVARYLLHLAEILDADKSAPANVEPELTRLIEGLPMNARELRVGALGFLNDVVAGTIDVGHRVCCVMKPSASLAIWQNRGLPATVLRCPMRRSMRLSPRSTGSSSASSEASA